MELNDGGLWDFQLSGSKDVRLTYKQTGPTEIVIYMLTDVVNPINLAASRLMKRHNVDILLCAGAIKDVNGVENQAVVFDDDIELVITARGHVLGVPCDVTGDGKVSAQDAMLILRATVEDPADVFPVYDTVSELNDYFEAYGFSGDAMLCMADPSGNGIISAYDAALAIQEAVGIVALAPALGSAERSCKLRVEDCTDGRLDVSIDLNDVRGVYSADIVMTYNPELMKLSDVSGTPAVSEWLFEHGTSDTGQLRLSLAGISQPLADGAIVTISFDVNGLSDAVKQLEIAEFKLNEGMLKTEVKNLPKAFALLQNYPNPFNPETWIPYQLSEPANVVVTIYSVGGQVIKRLELGVKMPDSYAEKSKAAYWDGTNQFGEQVSSGIYFYQLQAGSDRSVGKMIIAK
jgi:hypothetical protein